MKKLLPFLISTSLLSTSIMSLIACSDSKLKDSLDEEGLTEGDKLKEEINEQISDYITAPTENSDDGHGYMVKSYKDIGYKSFDEVNEDIKDQTIISNQNFENKIINNIIKPKLSTISEELKQKYDVFRDHEEIIQLEENMTIKKETIQFEEIFKLIKDENNLKNNDLANTPAEELGLIHKFSLSFSTKYKLNNDNVSRQHTLVFYIADDVSKFASIQDILTNYVKDRIIKFFKNLIYQNFSNEKVSEDISQLINTFTNRKYLATYIQNLFKSSNTEANNSVFKINGSAILASDTKNINSLIDKISNYEANLTDILDILVSEDPGRLNSYLKDQYDNYLNKEVFKEKKNIFEALKFSLDLVSSEFYGYNLKSIFIKDIRVNIKYSELISKNKNTIDKISTAIRFLFLNSDSKIEKLDPIKDFDSSLGIPKYERYYRWTLGKNANQPIWDASECFSKEEHCITWDDTGFAKSSWKNIHEYLINIINKDVLDKWFTKGKIQNDDDFKLLFNNFESFISLPYYVFRMGILSNYDLKEKPIEYGTNVRNRIHLRQHKAENLNDPVSKKTAYIWNFKLNGITIKTSFSWDYINNFIIQQR